jgi:thiol-disulfide isomerase/thioredoxin
MSYIQLPIITQVSSLQEFQQILQQNVGLVVLKLGAEWCGPCKRIQKEVEMGFNAMPDNVQKIILDIDDSLELYTYLKNKKRVNGIPAVLFWERGNLTDIPDDVVLGADSNQIIAFFRRAIVKATQMAAFDAHYLTSQL